MKHKEAWRVDPYCRSKIAIDPSPDFISFLLRQAARQGWTLEIVDWGIEPRHLGAA